jgi:hypothetical protein
LKCQFAVRCQIFIFSFSIPFTLSDSSTVAPRSHLGEILILGIPAMLAQASQAILVKRRSGKEQTEIFRMGKFRCCGKRWKSDESGFWMIRMAMITSSGDRVHKLYTRGPSYQLA